MANYPHWHSDQHPDFDAIMSRASADMLERLRNDPAFRTGVLSDPRDLHKTLYLPFAPPDYPEYAGTYRGTVNTTLEHRVSGAPSMSGAGATFQFVRPAEVPASIALVLPALATMRSQAGRPWDQLWALTNLFVQFGKIHPFLDGNGHLQRLLFAAGALDMGVPLSNRFAVHPRSYDFLLAHALERFTCSASDDDQSQWAMAVAEYLAQWLAGPFDTPGSGLAPL